MGKTSFRPCAYGFFSLCCSAVHFTAVPSSAPCLQHNYFKGKVSGMRKPLVLCLAFLFLAAGISFAGELLWQQKFDKEINWRKMTELGTLIYATDDGLYCLNPANGEQLWKLEDESMKKIQQGQVEFIPATPLMLLDIKKGKGNITGTLSAIDITDGKTVWATGEQKGMGVGVFPDYERGEIVYFMNDASAKPSLFIYDITTGAAKVSKDDFDDDRFEVFEVEGSGIIFKKFSVAGNQQPVFEGDFAYIAFPKPMKVDLNSGAIIWKCADGGVKKTHPMNGMAQMVSDGSALYVPNEDKLYAISCADGTVKWKTKGLPKWVGQIVEDGDALILKGDDKESGDGFVLRVSRADGAFLWGDPFKYKNSSCNMLIDGERILLVADGKLLTVAKADGKKTAEFKLKDAKFEELVNSLELRGDGLLLQAEQGACLLDAAGNKLIWSKTLEAPGASGWKRLAAVSLAVYNFKQTGAIGAIQSYRAMMKDSKKSKEMSTKFSSFNEKMSKRFGNSEQEAQWKFILTSLKDGPGLAALNLKTGQVESEVLLKDKKPDYDIDELEKRVFYLKDKSELQCYKF
jgi:outer membrane protein assembly factor BamB